MHNLGEAWRYTDVRSVLAPTYVLMPSVSVDVTAHLLPGCDAIVMINGVFDAEASSLPAELVCEWQVGHAIALDHSANVFDQMNFEGTQHTLCLTVPEGVRLKKPLHFLSVMTDVTVPSMLHQQCVIRMAPSSEATVFEDSVGGEGAACLQTKRMAITLEAHAALTYYKAQRTAVDVAHLATTTVSLGHSATLKHRHVTFSGRLNRETLQIALKGERASCELLGLYTAHQKQHIAHHIQVDHQAPRCETMQCYKGMAQDGARGVFDAKIVVHPEGAGAVAHQSNHNLLLSAEAEIDTKPGLEIYTDDVQCSHGATVGQLDEKALFYLQSRGISDADAKHLLVCGFASEVLMQWGEDCVADWIRDTMIASLSLSTCRGECHDR